MLQLEADVSWFVANSRERQFVFTGEMSSYERLLAHRVAQHWGLETTIISQGPDQGRILASRSPRTGSPRVRQGMHAAAWRHEGAGRGPRCACAPRRFA